MPFYLETPRLLLKQFAPEYAQHLFALNSDPDVVKYTGDAVYTSPADSALSQARNYEQYEKYKMGRLSVFIKATGEYIGWCGLRYITDKDYVDLGYRFMKKHWGKGYATESAAACLDYGFNTLNLNKITGTAMKENTASIRVFEKLGLRYIRDEDCGCEPGVVYEIVRSEFTGLKN